MESIMIQKFEISKTYRFTYYDEYGSRIIDSVMDSYGNFTDGYDEYGFVDGYNVTHILDGYEQKTFFMRIYDAWKCRRELYFINNAMPQTKQLVLDGYEEQEYLDIMIQKRNFLKLLCKTLDERDGDEEYERIFNKRDIKLRKYPKDSFIKIK
jgi:hypothetical protein